MRAESREDRMHLLKDYLRRNAGKEFCITELSAATAMKKTLPRKALTVDGDGVTPVAGVSMVKKHKPGGKLKRDGYWFSYVGE